MAIPSRQIGWGTEDNLLWQISKQLERLTCVTAGGCGAITTTTTTTILPSYKVYTAILSQDIEGVVTVQSEFENTLGNVNFSSSPYLGSIVIELLDIIVDSYGLIGFCYSAGDGEDIYVPWLVRNAGTAIYLTCPEVISAEQVNIRVDIKVYNYTVL
jgi:hypothetical protein